MTTFFDQIKSFDKILYKTLSANDYRWASEDNIHQAGVLITRELIRFFPALNESLDIDSKDIKTFWLEAGLWKQYESKWIHYTSKAEFRITRLSKKSFINIEPGSLLLIGKNKGDFYCFIVNSGEVEKYNYALDILNLRESPKWGILKKENGRLIEIIDKLDSMLNIPKNLSEIPSILELYNLGLKLFNVVYGDLYSKSVSNTPGDIIEKLIDFEYQIYRKYEFEVFSSLLVDKSVPDIFMAKNIHSAKEFFGLKLDQLSDVFMSMAQARKTRMGTTYELHVKQYLHDLDIPFEYQQSVDGKKRPDFILPSKSYYYSESRKPDDAILLSLKSTVKERWAQILNEGHRIKTRYLATLDKSVTTDQIQEMKEKNVILIVTEWAKKNTESYKTTDNVITFKDFANIVLKSKRLLWK